MPATPSDSQQLGVRPAPPGSWGGALALPEFPERDFQDFCRLIQDRAGICLPEHKRDLLRSRLSKVLRGRPIASFRDYFRQVLQDGSGRELTQLLDAVSTNQTAFLREPAHFQFLAKELLPTLERAGAGRRLSLWSAGCSSGEEPYTLAMLLLDVWGERASSRVRIYASDLSTQVLAQARRGIYAESRLEPVSSDWQRRFFQKGVNRCRGLVRVKPEVQRLVTFFHFNLMAASYPFQAELDLIFCRNVMIYFNKETQTEVVRKLNHCLKPGGHLFIGHSESLCNLEHRFAYVKPTIYRK